MSVEQASVKPTTTVRVPEHVVYRAFAAETVVLDLRSGRYHGLNPTGGRMLATLDTAKVVRVAAEQLAREYGQPLERLEHDLCRFCEELSSRGLIDVVGEAR